MENVSPAITFEIKTYFVCLSIRKSTPWISEDQKKKKKSDAVFHFIDSIFQSQSSTLLVRKHLTLKKVVSWVPLSHTWTFNYII